MAKQDKSVMPIETPDWSESARLSSQLWFSMDSATRFILLREWGLERTAELEFQFTRTHQLRHFLDGVSKLGIKDHPHPRLCAEYHCLSNVIGGLDMGFRDDGDRCWVFYYPPAAFAGSPLLATPAIPAVPVEIFLSGMRAWHANNGELLGNDRLQYVVTDLIAAGGPFDAGYWVEAPRSVRPENRMVVRLGEELAQPGPPPSLSAAAWPQERRDAAIRKYNAEYSIGGLAEIEQRCGIADTARIAEASHRSVFLAWARQLVGTFGITTEDPVLRVQQLFRKCFELLDDRFEETVDGKRTLLIHISSRLSLPQYAAWGVLPLAIEQSFARAWTTISRALGPPVVVKVLESRSQGAAQTVWSFERAA